MCAPPGCLVLSKSSRTVGDLIFFIHLCGLSFLLGAFSFNYRLNYIFEYSLDLGAISSSRFRAWP